MTGLLMFFVPLLSAAGVSGIDWKCHWSNEECRSSEECCSKECYLAHEGADYRCTRSSLSQTCVFDYHCRDNLNCGPHYNCCAPYWQSCVQNKDCCDSSHKCQHAAGFIYKKCLFPSHGNQVIVNFDLYCLFIAIAFACNATSSFLCKRPDILIS